MTQRIRYARPGDILSAQYVNRIVDGANRALAVLGPPISTRTSGEGTIPVELDASGDPVLGNDPNSGALAFLGTEVLSELSRVVSTVRIFDPNDSSVFVDVDRKDQVKMSSSERFVTLIFANP